MRKSLEHFKQEERGAVAIEFGIVAVALVLLFVAVIDLGMGFYRKMQVQAAVQRAGMFATIRGFETAGITSAITSSRGAPQAIPAPRQFCGCPVTSGISEVACTATCTSGPTAPGIYVTASARGSYALLLPYPVLSSPLVFEASQTVRIR